MKSRLASSAMPNFNILRTIGGLRTSPRPAPIITKDLDYDTASALSPANSITRSHSASIPTEIIKSQPITDPSLGRRGTLKKRNKARCFQILVGLARIIQSSNAYSTAITSQKAFPWLPWYYSQSRNTLKTMYSLASLLSLTNLQGMSMPQYPPPSCQRSIHFRMKTITNKDFKSIQAQILAPQCQVVCQDLTTVSRRLAQICLHLEEEHTPSVMADIIADITDITITVASLNLRSNMSMESPMPHLRHMVIVTVTLNIHPGSLDTVEVDPDPDLLLPFRPYTENLIAWGIRMQIQ